MQCIMYYKKNNNNTIQSDKIQNKEYFLDPQTLSIGYFNLIKVSNQYLLAIPSVKALTAGLLAILILININ